MTVDLEGLDQTDVCLVLEAFRQRLRFMGPAHPNAGRMQLLIDRMEMAQLAAALEEERGREVGLTSADGADLAAAGFGVAPERGEPRFEMGQAAPRVDMWLGNADLRGPSGRPLALYGNASLSNGRDDFVRESADKVLALRNCRCSDEPITVRSER